MYRFIVLMVRSNGMTSQQFSAETLQGAEAMIADVLRPQPSAPLTLIQVVRLF